MDSASASPSRPFQLGPRRAVFVPIADLLAEGQIEAPEPSPELVASLERYDLLYRTLCAVLYNFVPTSGHPGGSISSGRISSSLLFTGLDYDFSEPDEPANDLLVYAAGHKAMGLYAMWALRNEVVRAAAPDLLPDDERFQLRLEDLLGFRRNPTNRTPLYRKFNSKPLDGHPTPLTPGVRIATGASGVGVPAGLGLALGALDTFGPEKAPRLHLLEGEGGMTPGRVSEAMAMAATGGLSNAYLHVDWNQASIDSNRVCRSDDGPGEYVQWNPVEFAYLHDWNVYLLGDGCDWQQILAAQALARRRPNDQPSAIVYPTTKGWRYGITGRTSHGAGHKFCSDEYYAVLRPCEEIFDIRFPRHEGGKDPDEVERTYWNTLTLFRQAIEKSEFAGRLAAEIGERKQSLEKLDRRPRAGGPSLAPLYDDWLDERLQYRQGLSRRLLPLARESGSATPLLRWDLRGRDRRRPRRTLVLRQSHRSGLLLRRVHRRSPACGQPSARNRAAGASRHLG
jgi:transketolase